METKKLKIFLFLAIIINFYMVLGLIPIFNLDEGVFTEATREMLANKDFITTYLNGELRFAKPILIYWLQALSVSIFGLNEFAFRLPSALAATFWALGIYYFAKKIYNEEIGILSSIFMVSSLQISIIGKAAMADSVLNMFIAFSMFSLFLYIKELNKKYLYLTFAFVGAGFLTKGPIAIFIPFTTFFIYQLLRKDLKFFFKSVVDIKGIIIFSIIALPWYVLEFKAQGMKFIISFFLKNNIARFDTTLERHGGSIFYYIPVILIGLLPWTTLIIKYFFQLKNIKNKDDFFIFGTIWFFVVFIFFSFSGTKLPHYIIYGYTPLFIFMALVFKDIKNEFLLSLPFILFIVLLLIIPLVINSSLGHNMHTIANILNPYFNWVYYCSLIIVLFLSIIKIGNTKKSLILAFSMIFVVNYVAWIYAHVRAFPLKNLAGYVREHNIKKVIMYQMKTPSFNTYAQMITPMRHPKKGEIVITKVKNLKNLKNFKILKKEGTVVLIKIN